MVFVHTRVTSEDDNLLNSVILHIRSEAKCILAVQEISKEGKKHIHVVSEYGKTASTFGQRLVKAFPQIKGNRSHSTAEIREDLDTNIRYCSKGTKEILPVVLFTTLDKSVIEDAHKKFWEIQKKFVTENAKGEENVKKKVKTESFVRKICDRIPDTLANSYTALQGLYNPSDYERALLEKDRNDIMDICILSFGHAAKTIDDYILSRHINAVFTTLVSENGNKEQKAAMCARLRNRVGHSVY